MNDKSEELLKFVAELGVSTEPTTTGISSFDDNRNVVERASKYLDKVPIAVDGSNGSSDCFKAACICRKGFLLSIDDSLDAMRNWNANCQPPWSERELRHKLEDAGKASGPSGYLAKTSEAKWASVKIPDYKQPATKNRRVEPEATRTTLREATKKHLTQIREGKQQLIATGINEIDYAIGGGVGFGEIALITARPSHGKSAVTLQILDNITATGMPCLFCSEEMSAISLGKRATQIVTAIPQDRWKASHQVVETQLDAHFSKRAECFIVEHNRSAEKVAESICKHAKEDGVKVACVDYVQLLSNSKGSRYETVTETSVILKQAASESGVTLLVLAQMSRAIENRDSFIPKMSDIKESGQLEQDADVILFLVWPNRIDSSKPYDEYRIYVAKNRNREIVRHCVSMKFEASRQRIVSPDDRFANLSVPSDRGQR